MVSKRERLHQLLTNRFAESPQHIPETVLFHRSPIEIRQDFAAAVHEIKRRGYAESDARIAQEEEEEEREFGDIRYLWGDVLPVNADMSDDLFRRLSADDELHRLAVEGLVGYNWQAATIIMRDKYGMHETGYAIDRKVRKETGNPVLVDWKRYIAERPDIQKQSPKLKRREILGSGYGRVTKREQQRKDEYKRRAAERKRIARGKNGTK